MAMDDANRFMGLQKRAVEELLQFFERRFDAPAHQHQFRRRDRVTGAIVGLLGVACFDHHETQEDKPEDEFERWHDRGASLRGSITVALAAARAKR